MFRLGDVSIVYATWIPLLLALLCLLLAWRGFRAQHALWRPPAVLLALVALICLGAGMGGMPVVMTNAQLQALPSYQWLSVLRMGVNQAGDAEPQWFTPSTIACTLNSGAGDVGSQNSSVDGGCFNAVFPPTGPEVQQWGCVSNATDVSACLNKAVAGAIALHVGQLNFPGNSSYYGICAAPLTFLINYTNTTLNLVAQGATIKVLPSCATPPPEVVSYNYAFNPTTSWQYKQKVAGFTFDGSYITKYVWFCTQCSEIRFEDNTFQNPAPASVQTGSAGVYWYGLESFLGRGNKIIAINQPGAGNDPYTSPATMPAYGINITSGNSDFTGLLVVGYNQGIYDNSGDNSYGPGTHVWGGVDYVSGGAVYNANIRTIIGLDMVKDASKAYGVEIDDPAQAGIYIGSAANGRAIANGTDCIFSPGDALTTQNCVEIAGATGGALITGTTAPQLQSAGLSPQIVMQDGSAANSTIVALNPMAGYGAGDVGLSGTTGSTAMGTNPTGFIGPLGWTSGASPNGNNWMVGSCWVRRFQAFVSSAPPGGGTFTFTVYVNGAATSMTGSITGANFSTPVITSPVASISSTSSMSVQVTSTGAVPSDTASVRLLGCS